MSVRQEIQEEFNKKFPVEKLPLSAPTISEQRGVGGQRQCDGGASLCVCPRCGHREPHERGVPACPDCGAKMIGESLANLAAIRPLKSLHTARLTTKLIRKVIG